MNSDATLLKEAVFGDLAREIEITRTVLDRLPEDHFSWQPHPKSMTLGRLASHVADLPEWARGTLENDFLDIADAKPPAPISGHADLLARFDKNASALAEMVARFDISRWPLPWSMRNGADIMVSRPRSHVYRVWCINHMIHHRAQLCLYLRLLNVPVPTVYFNTADDPNWVFA